MENLQRLELKKQRILFLLSKGSHLAMLKSVANYLTLLRLGLILPTSLFLVLSRVQTKSHWNNLAILAFCLLCLTDFFDGFIARRFKQMTYLGKILDPLVDKMTILIISFLLWKLYMPNSAYPHFPLWLLLAFISKEALLYLHWEIYRKKLKGISQPSVTQLGKFITLCQFITIGWFMLPTHILNPIHLAVVTLACSSFLIGLKFTFLFRRSP